MNLKLPFLAALCAGAIGLAGCNAGVESTQTIEPTNKPTASAPEKKPLKIALIAKSQNNPVFQAAKVGAEAAAKELSDKEGVAVTVDWLTPPTESGEEQAKRIAQAVNDGANAIIISCSDAAKVTGAINEAVDKGVPVFTFDSDAPDSKRFGFYGADDMEIGHQVMKELVAIGGEKLHIAILAGNQTAPNLQRRVEGVKMEAKGHPGVKIVNTFYHIESPQEATKAVQNAMRANPEIDAWAMIGGWPLFATALLNEIDPTKVKIVAVDCLPAQLAYVDKGVAPVLLAQPVYEWGYKSVNFVYDKVNRGADVQPINKMELVRVDKSNLSEFAQKLKDWGFTDPEIDKYLAK